MTAVAVARSRPGELFDPVEGEKHRGVALAGESRKSVSRANTTSPQAISEVLEVEVLHRVEGKRSRSELRSTLI